MTIPLIDAHLDLSWNALAFDREQTLTVEELRRSEKGLQGKSRCNNTVSLPEMRKGDVGICLATVLARTLPQGTDKKSDLSGINVSPLVMRARQPVVLRENLDYSSQYISSAIARGQMAYYKIMEERGEMRMIRTRGDLKSAFKKWTGAKPQARKKLPISYILSMEGADPIIDEKDAEWWFEAGLRTVCLSHYGQSAYSMGTGGDGPLTKRGKSLAKKLDKLGMIIDVVHTADTALRQILDIYSRPVFVSHGNSRTLVPGDRQISDEQIGWIAERGGVLGVVMDCWMLKAGWTHGKSGNEAVSMETVADHIDHICQVTGSADHASIGSDLDGGFGTEQSPHDIGTIAGLQKLGPILKKRGYGDEDVKKVFHGNWMRFFGENLPK